MLGAEQRLALADEDHGECCARPDLRRAARSVSRAAGAVVMRTRDAPAPGPLADTVEVELPERPTAASLERWASGRGSATFDGVSRSRGALRASLQRRGRWRWPATLSTFSARCGHLWRKTRPNAGFLQMHNLQGLRLRHEAQDSYLHILIGGQCNRVLASGTAQSRSVRTRSHAALSHCCDECAPLARAGLAPGGARSVAHRQRGQG